MSKCSSKWCATRPQANKRAPPPAASRQPEDIFLARNSAMPSTIQCKAYNCLSLGRGRRIVFDALSEGPSSKFRSHLLSYVIVSAGKDLDGRSDDRWQSRTP